MRCLTALPAFVAGVSAFLLTADSLALPKLRIAAEGGLIELVRPAVRELSEQMPEHQPVLAADADALDARPLLAISTNRLPDVQPIPFALKGTILAVNRKNPLNDISSGDVMKIMKNQYPYWQGTDVPVRNIYLASGSLRSKSGPSKGKTHFVETSSAQIAAELVKKDVTAVALLPLAYLLEPDNELKLLSVDGVAPEFEPVMNGRYPLVKRYSLSLDPAAPEAVRKLAERLLSPAFRSSLPAHGFIPLRKDGN